MRIQMIKNLLSPKKLQSNTLQSDILLTQEQIEEYHIVLNRYSKLKFKDKHSANLTKINYISFFTTPVIDEINTALVKDPAYQFTKEVTETIKYYNLIRIGSHRVIDIVRYNSEKDINTLEELYKENSKIFYNRDEIKNYLNSDYLIAIYKAIKLKLYKE